MRGSNFISFFTVQGFFLGIVFALLKSDTAEGLIIYTFLITIFFYLFSHIMVAFYFQTLSSKATMFSRDAYERELDAYVNDISAKEDMIESVYAITDAAAKLNKLESKRLKAAQE